VCGSVRRVELFVAGLTDLDVFDVPRDLGGRRGRYATLEDRPLRRQRPSRRTAAARRRSSRRHDGTPHRTDARRMTSLNVRPSDECHRRLSGRHDGELDMGQRTGRCRFFLLNAVCFAISVSVHCSAMSPSSSLLDVWEQAVFCTNCYHDSW